MAAPYANNPVAIKAEPLEYLMNGDCTQLKVEPVSAGASPSAQSDEDLYEDAGDLDYANAISGVYLTRIPRYLWENWSKLDDEEEIRLGTIRMEGGGTDNIQRMSLLLSADMAQNRSVPKEYNMHITNLSSSNTFVFTEKDLPGFASKSRRGALPGKNATGLSSQKSSQSVPYERPRQGSHRIDKNNRWQPYFRKAIPKQTALAGHVKVEVNCLPVENTEYRRVIDHRAKQAIKPKKETKLLSGIVAGGNPGTLGHAGNFDTFIKQAGPARGKTQESKAARMPQNELLDLIYDCFKRYSYWPFKSLKAELNQPEAYLKQTLEMVAHLVRQGTHAMTWQLKPESKIGAYADARLYESVKDEVAPDMGLDGTLDYKDVGEAIASDLDDDNIEMEDVLPP